MESLKNQTVTQSNPQSPWLCQDSGLQSLGAMVYLKRYRVCLFPPHDPVKVGFEFEKIGNILADVPGYSYAK